MAVHPIDNPAFWLGHPLQHENFSQDGRKDGKAKASQPWIHRL